MELPTSYLRAMLGLARLNESRSEPLDLITEGQTSNTATIDLSTVIEMASEIILHRRNQTILESELTKAAETLVSVRKGLERLIETRRERLIESNQIQALILQLSKPEGQEL